MTSVFRAVLVATYGVASSLLWANHRHPQPSARNGPVRRSVESAALASESRSNGLAMQQGMLTVHDCSSPASGLDEIRRSSSAYKLSDGNRRSRQHTSEPLHSWFNRFFRTTLAELHEQATLPHEEAKMFQKTWDKVRSALPAGSGSLDVARNATALLAGWATHKNNKGSTARLRLARGLAIAKYIGQTPYGDDGTVVAAALLCEAHESALSREAHESGHGLRLDDVRNRIGDDAAVLLQSLSNLEQLLELQRSRWDAQGDGCANETKSGTAGDGELLYSCRLPATHAENLLYMVVAMTDELRALPIMLARRLEALRDECAAQRETGENRTTPSSLARDVLDVYAPLAARFGLYTLKNDLEDAAFERLAPVARARIVHALNATCRERATVLQDVSTRLRRLMMEDDVLMNSVDCLRISTREKEPYSVWRKQRKLREQRQEDEAQSVETIFPAQVQVDDESPVFLPLDTVAFRIVLEPYRGAGDTAAHVAAGEHLCYRALSLVRSTWPALPNRTKDYVDKPKANGYQSLHTTVLMRLHGESHPFEVQIRTFDMHLTAEYGSAAHVRYSRLWSPPEQIYGAPDAHDKLVANLKADLARSAYERSPSHASQQPQRKWGANDHVARSRIKRHPLALVSSGTEHDDPSRSSRDDHHGVSSNAANQAVNYDEPFRVRHDLPPLDIDPAATGKKYAQSLSDHLRAERIFGIASGGRVVKVSASSNGIFECHGALMKDMEADAELQGELPTNPENFALLYVVINGKIIVGYLDILSACSELRRS